MIISAIWDFQKKYLGTFKKIIQIIETSLSLSLSFKIVLVTDIELTCPCKKPFTSPFFAILNEVQIFKTCSKCGTKSNSYLNYLFNIPFFHFSWHESIGPMTDPRSTVTPFSFLHSLNKKLSLAFAPLLMFVFHWNAFPSHSTSIQNSAEVPLPSWSFLKHTSPWWPSTNEISGMHYTKN